MSISVYSVGTTLPRKLTLRLLLAHRARSFRSYRAVPERKRVLTNTAIYIWVCLFQSILALAISHGGMAALDAMTGGSAGGW